MRNEKKINGTTMLDKHRKLRIERFQFRSNTKTKYWIEIENSLTKSLYKLPGLTKADLQTIKDLIDTLDNTYENGI